jgi:hypothetical protein
MKFPQVKQSPVEGNVTLSLVEGWAMRFYYNIEKIKRIGNMIQYYRSEL